jgi:D-alanyl-D-alanine carboxypeptidase/D-alanyl-D-alanine-endopeptidase (penicillin-binding protein 4)
MARRFLLFAVFAAVLSPFGGTAAASPASQLRQTLSRAMSGAGSQSGAFVMDAGSGRTMFSRRGTTPRILASNTKLFTSAAVLGRYGRSSALATTLIGSGSLQPDGSWKGSIYLRGGGDPTFGSRSFARSTYGSNATVETLADQLDKAGFKSVTGSVIGDESSFDSYRGGPSSGYGTSVYVGPLSALSFNRGLANSQGSAFQSNPPLFAATRLDQALSARGIAVKGKPRTGAAPSSTVVLTEVRSPDVAHLLRLQNKDSDNFFAEMLLKGLPMTTSSGGSLRRSGAAYPLTPTPDAPEASSAKKPATRGTTKAGTRVAAAYARSLGVKVQLADGSGLSRSDRAAPKQIARLLRALRRRAGFSAFYASLPIAGRDGTLAGRMRSGPARGRCHAKTGTLSDVSALSGYCVSRSGRTLIFSVLNNRTNIYNARAVQDRVAQALAGYRG